MNALSGPALSRRSLLGGGGALILSFSLAPRSALSQSEEAQVSGTGPLPGSLSDFPYLDSWIRIDEDDSITVFTGKAELGQGIRTALIQVAAEQLDVDFSRVVLETADTGQTPNEGYTAASHSMSESGTAILNAAAQVRALLIARAADQLGLSADQLTVDDGVITGGGRSLSYGKLVGPDVLHVQAQPQSPIKDPSTNRIIGKAVRRIDIPAKLTGAVAYVQDLRLPGMVHARVVRPPVYGARLTGIDTSEVETMPGVVQVIRDGNYLAVVARGEFQAIQAMRALAAAAEWGGGIALPEKTEIYDVLKRLPSQESVIQEKGSGGGQGTRIEAAYHRPYQLHGSIGPSCAVGHVDGDRLTVWSHTQGVYPDRDAIAEMVRMPPENVRVIHMEGAGCYGHNGADDAAADAALIATKVPGTPVRVQWMREDEHRFEPYGSAMVVEASAALGESGTITDWVYDVWSTPHSTRPGSAGNLLAANLIADPFQADEPISIPQPAGGGDRNAVPGYDFPNSRVTKHFIRSMPLRVSAMRSLGAYMNVFALESFMDELALKAGADPVEFRLKHLSDPRARDVVTTVADRFGWSDWKRKGPGHGRGFAYARYKNLAVYCAVALEIEVEREAGLVRILRAVAATDSGQAVNPDGIRNQTEGGIVQSASWTLYEEVDYSTDEILSRDWASYPIMRFPAVPGAVEVHVIDRPGEPFLGTGEGSQGPTAAAIANAFADATGRRIRDLPLSPEKIRRTLEA
ncbi:xanthine dehydrogenase family protein molybdopterin-binding subunit [Jiella avicenniae]|uniref:Molybdopterin-dependent oxidoreductase n=1 Tax=Jiella avicenniae TaxID=2907202 RepID=A0A9X1T6U4_9HYPH|nr:molybdopterin cofactor-binding domain-containing protein [Jiella avicenniae]MCE7030189.1 molybdopterin-dependent oxidoreductase [Jiella avicenniae]